MTRPPDYQKYRSDRQIARILAAAAIAPMSANQLGATLGMSVSGVLRYVKDLRADGLMHIAAYDQSGRGRATPLYKAGNAPDANYTPKRKAKLPDRVTKRMEPVREALAIPRTSKQVAAFMNLTTARAVFYIAALRADKEAYIIDCAPAQGQGDIAPIYALGSKRDKKKPRQTRAQRYKRDMRDDDKREMIQAQRRARTDVARAVRTPNTWFATLGAV